MATAPAPMTVAAPLESKRELVVVSHSTLFYWWPVWAFGFLMALITLVEGRRMTTVPKDTKAVPNQEVKGFEGNRDILVLPVGGHLETRKGNPADPKLLMSANKNLGVLFCFVLLLVVTITNIPLRGLWSVIVIVILLSLAIILAILDKWEDIIEYLGFLDIRINVAGYALISFVLFVLWLLIFLFFDKQVYMVFTPGQFRVRLEIGDAETAYDTAGMTIQKQRSDLFRHWILGLGSGDLIVRTAGAQAHQFDMPNVLFLGRKVKEIEELLRSKQVVSG
jgi:uncharacterized membrane protein YtjA (UPF0391 family)